MKRKKILVICPHPENVAPGQRLKYEQYFEHFRQNGYDVTVSPFESRRLWNIKFKRGLLIFLEKVGWTIIGYIKRFFLLFQVPRYDIVYVFLWVTPFGPPIFERMVSGLSKRMIYDIDDLIFLKNTSMEVKLVGALKGNNKPKFLMKRARHVITCTPYLTEYALKYNKNTTDISSTINTAVYHARKDYGIRENKIVLGWSGSNSTSRFLQMLAPVLLALKEKISFHLLVMGDGNFSIPGIEVEALPWKASYETEIISRFDIGLYPLPDEQWVYGKSGLKALQYMSMGIPTVATAIGANFRVIDNEVNGFLVKNEQEWLERILALATNEQLRKSIGEKAREKVEKLYSVNANAPVYINILEKVMNN